MKTKVFFVEVFLLLLFLFILPKGLEAAYLKLEPATVSSNANETFTINVNIDTENEEVNSADVYITYDAGLLEAQQVVAGSFFPTVTNNIASGRLYIAGLVEDPASSKKGTGTIATVTFKALKDGFATLSIDCSSSKIVKADVNATNILECSKNGSSQVTIGSGTTTDNNSSASNNQSSTDNSNSQSLPKTGFLDNLVNVGLPGLILLTFGLVGKILLKY